MPSDLDPPRPAATDSGRSVPDLLANLVSQISTLFRQEIRLARAEMGEKLSQTTTAILPIGAGVALLLAATVVLLFSLAEGITAWTGLDIGWSLLIVGAAFAVIGFVLLRSGVSQLKLKGSNLMPERTAEQVSRDARVAKEQVR
jgi:Putative Actinobacterial Holin-X, holin superfamily III